MKHQNSPNVWVFIIVLPNARWKIGILITRVTVTKQKKFAETNKLCKLDIASWV
jgi:hypothetical protein